MTLLNKYVNLGVTCKANQNSKIVGKIIIDAFQHAARKEKIEGVLLVSHSRRLSQEVKSEDASLNWVLSGEKRGREERRQLDLSVRGAVELECQRCLAPLTLLINSRSTLLLARSEAEAELIDSLLEMKNGFDMLVCEKMLDVTELIEDEVLLSLPHSPRHYPVCPGQGAAAYEKNG